LEVSEIKTAFEDAAFAATTNEEVATAYNTASAAAF
jgi:hypothetical protein